jgi:hypothetical protein
LTGLFSLLSSEARQMLFSLYFNSLNAGRAFVTTPPNAKLRRPREVPLVAAGRGIGKHLVGVDGKIRFSIFAAALFIAMGRVLTTVAMVANATPADGKRAY